MCSAPTFCAWRRLPLICLKLLVGVCVRDGLAASLFIIFNIGIFVLSRIYIYLYIYVVALLLLPLSFFLGVGAPSFSLASFMF